MNIAKTHKARTKHIEKNYLVYYQPLLKPTAKRKMFLKRNEKKPTKIKRSEEIKTVECKRDDAKALQNERDCKWNIILLKFYR